MLSNFLGGANSTNSAGTNSGVSAPAPAHAQSNQAPVLSQVPEDANRANAVMLAQAQQAANQASQTTQAPQAQSPEAQIKALFAALDPMSALNLLMELLAPFYRYAWNGSSSSR